MYIALVVAHYLVILYCCKKIRYKIKNASSKSRRSQAEQTAQLKKIFTAQAVTPLVVAIVPMCAYVAMLAFSVEWLGHALTLSTTLLSWIPTANAVFTIAFANAYRRAVKDFVCRKLLGTAYGTGAVSVTETTAVVHVPQEPANA
ncbi:hypothetical protein AAVH_39840 [Aphelenchoides avenae]|nr:hypothetical protein AAVH_39840 [Aphelenchus avenae]